jgi:accessory gene regulator protein AgrB
MAISDLFSLKSGDFGDLLYELHWIVGAKIHPKTKKRTLMMDLIIPGFLYLALFSKEFMGWWFQSVTVV